MANVRLANAAQQAAMDAVTALIDGGSGAGVIELRSGSQPADGNATATGSLIGTLTWTDPAFGAANTSGVATASAITGDSSADASGVITWARVKDSNGLSIFDCDVGTSGATLNLNNVNVTAGDALAVTSFTLTHPDGT